MRFSGPLVELNFTVVEREPKMYEIFSPLILYEALDGMYFTKLPTQCYLM